MKSYKTTVVLLIFIGLFVTARAQDVILKNDNTTILSKIIEISDTNIKYKKWSNQDGPTYTLSSQEIKSITFQNGDIETFQTDLPTTTIIDEKIIEQESYQQTIQHTQQQQTTPRPSHPNYSRGRVQFSLNGGLAIPLGKFGEVSNDYYCAPFCIYGADELEIGYGAAKKGFNASMKLHIPIYRSNNHSDILGILLKFNFLYNGIDDKEKRDFRNQLEEMADEFNAYYGTYAYYYQIEKYSSYQNFSFMFGFDYTHYFSKPFALFAELNAGFNVAHISSSVIKNLYGGSFVYSEGYTNYYSEDQTNITFKSKLNFVFEAGAGIFVFDHISLGVFYTGYTPFQVTPKMEAISHYGTDEMEVTSNKLKISALSVQLGIHF
jgi:hypothetical protein